MKINLQEGHWTYQTMEVIKIMGSGYCVLWPKTQSGLEITAKQFEVCTPPELQANIINWPTLQRQRLLSLNGVHCPFSVCYITKIYPVMHCLTSSEFNSSLFLLSYWLRSPVLTWEMDPSMTGLVFCTPSGVLRLSWPNRSCLGISWMERPISLMVVTPWPLEMGGLSRLICLPYLCPSSKASTDALGVPSNRNRL